LEKQQDLNSALQKIRLPLQKSVQHPAKLPQLLLVQLDPVVHALLPVEKGLQKILPLLRGEGDPVVTVGEIGAVDAVVIFIGSCNNNAPAGDGINVVFNLKSNRAAQIYIYFTFGMKVRIVLVKRGVSAELDVVCFKLNP
jgi:hypothetical protein